MRPINGYETSKYVFPSSLWYRTYSWEGLWQYSVDKWSYGLIPTLKYLPPARCATPTYVLENGQPPPTRRFWKNLQPATRGGAEIMDAGVTPDRIHRNHPCQTVVSPLESSYFEDCSLLFLIFRTNAMEPQGLKVATRFWRKYVIMMRKGKIPIFGVI